MIKSQQFYILKFSSSRLKKAKFTIDITLDDAKKNSEVITINSSELIRTLFRYKKIDFDQKELDELLILQKRLRKAENTEKNRQKLLEISQNIEKMLFIEDLVSIEFKNKLHYLAILKKGGFFINGCRFTPFMASAGMIRRNTALFVNNNIKYQLLDILENGRNPSAPLVTAKFGAYFSLYSSSTLPVSFPNFVVVPDKTIEKVRRVDFVTYQGVDIDDRVEEKDCLIKANAWDGQGLISPRLAQQWSKELGLDYTFSCAIIRAPFTKGLVTVFDFHKFAQEIAHKNNIIDIYGDERDISDIDLIISESMFKLYNAYDNTADFIYNCQRNHLGFSVAKVNLKKEKSFCRTSYQFLQVLDLNNVDIVELCEPTVSWFRDISGDNPINMLLYATGEHEFDPTDFHKMDISVKAILLNPRLARDPYIQNRFIKTITKKKKEAYMGSLLVNGNYQFMIGDPYYQACHIFGLPNQPLLREGEHYSEYWLNRHIDNVGAIRSPIVHHSEFNQLHFKDTPDTRKWFAHIHSGIIFPANGEGMDCAIHGGSDMDGDLICTVNNPTMLRGKQPGLPIIYESRKAEKTIVDIHDDQTQVENQLNGYNSKVGFATNISSSIYCMLEEFPPWSEEHAVLLNRLKIGRVIQGEIIDGVKGLKVPPFREHWTKYKHIDENMTPEEVEKWEFNNRILCKVRPAFFRFLYPHYMTRYNKEIKRYNLYCHMRFKKSLDEILKNPARTPAEEELVREYKTRSYFLDNNAIVNRISRYMRASVGLIGKYTKKGVRDFDFHILQSGNTTFSEANMQKMSAILQAYRTFKKDLRHHRPTAYTSLDAYLSYLRKECYATISSNEAELADYAVEVTYGEQSGSVEFAWILFPEGIFSNILRQSPGRFFIPTPDPYGDISYLWTRYIIKEFPLEALYEP